MRLRDTANASDAGAVEAEIWRIWGEATDRDAQALCRSLGIRTEVVAEGRLPCVRLDVGYRLDPDEGIQLAALERE